MLILNRMEIQFHRLNFSSQNTVVKTLKLIMPFHIFTNKNSRKILGMTRSSIQ